METKAFYIKRLLSTLGIGAIGLIIAEVLFNTIPAYEGSVFLGAALLAGMPFGWMALRQVFGGMVVWGLWGIVIYYLLMFVCAVAIGWMIMCYRFVRDIVQLTIVICNEQRARKAAQY